MSLKVLYLFGLLLVIIKNCVSTPKSFITYRMKAEKLFVQSALLSNYAVMQDEVCNLSDEKKIELCRIIFESKFYKTLSVRLNNTALFKTKLPCLKKFVTLKHYSPPHSSANKRLTKMYPCYGRHVIIRTSFIEDDNYNKFYVSAGPSINSVTVYLRTEYRTYSEINVFNHVYNVDLSKLDSKIISEKDVISELKLKSKIYFTGDSVDAANIYDIAQKNYVENDPICDLPYEKKVTLCKLLFDQNIYKHEFQLILNKSATYIFDMTCVTKPVYSDFPNIQTQLQSKQKMYPCQGRSRILGIYNALDDPYINKFFLSSGPRRNSLFVYFRTIEYNYTETYAVAAMLENINMFSLQPTTITVKELKEEESITTYNEIENMLKSNEIAYYNEFLRIITQTKPEETKKEEEMINQILQKAALDFEPTSEKWQEIQQAEIEKLVAENRQKKSADSTVNTPDISSVDEQTLQKNIKEQLLKELDLFTQKDMKKIATVDSINLADALHLGPQSFKRILDKMRAGIEHNKNIYFKGGSYEPIVKVKKRNPKLKSKMQQLIEQMETRLS